MQNIWFTSDTHFGHTNLVKGVSRWENTDRCRNFKSVEEHDEKLIYNINKLIKYNDILYFLGDWSFAGAENIIKYRNRLNVQTIHLLYGNHDLHIKKNRLIDNVKVQSLFTSCQDYLEKEIHGTKFVMSHYPILSWHNKKDNETSSIHLYGHTHNSIPVYHKYAVEVGVDCHKGFRPFSIDEIKDIIKNREYA